MKIFPSFTYIGGYSVAPITFEEYKDACKRLEQLIFGEYFLFDLRSSQTAEHLEKTARWKTLQAQLYKLCLGIFHNGELVGWHYSQQLPDGGILMRDTGLLPSHQGKGIYSFLLPQLIAYCKKSGFDCIRSYHRATNNAVIVPKLKNGFIITGFEIDENGVSVKLVYPFNENYRESLKVRSGECRPRGRIAELFGLTP